MEYLLYNIVQTPYALSLDSDVEIMGDIYPFLSEYESFDLACKLRPTCWNPHHPLYDPYNPSTCATGTHPNCPYAYFAMVKMEAVRQAKREGAFIRHKIQPMMPHDPDPESQRFTLHHELFGIYLHWLMARKRPYAQFTDYPPVYHYCYHATLTNLGNEEQRERDHDRQLKVKRAAWQANGLPLPQELQGCLVVDQAGNVVEQRKEWWLKAR